MKDSEKHPNKKILRFEQDQRSDRWVPEEDEDCVPHKLTYDFLVFLGKDPAGDEFYLHSSEIDEIVNMRFAIDLQPTKGCLIETVCTYFIGILVWKDHLRNRFIGMKRNELGRYADPQTASSKETLKKKLMGFEVRKDARNIHR